jgi:hypothetical protein
MSAQLIELTGIAVLDEVTGGQLRPGAHLLIGPTGVGKTTLLVQLLAERAWECLLRRRHSGEDTTAVFVYLEDRAEEIQERLLSYLSQLPRQMVWFDESSTAVAEPPIIPEGVAGYSERSTWLQSLSTAERLAVAVMCITDFVTLVDLREASFGVSRPSNLITQQLAAIREEGRRLSFVGVDHSSLIMQRHFQARECDAKYHSHRIKAFVKDIMEYGTQVGCPVWVVHQASGAANTYLPDRPLLATDAKNCKGLGEVSDIVVTLGNRGHHHSDRQFQLVCAKRPISLGGESVHRWVEVDSDIAAIVPASEPPPLRRQPSQSLGAPLIHQFWVSPDLIQQFQTWTGEDPD